MRAWDKDFGQTTFSAWETVFTCTCSCESRPDVDACSYIDYRAFKGNGDNFITADPPGFNLLTPPPPILVLWPRLLLYTATEPPPLCRGGASRVAATHRGKAGLLDLVNPLSGSGVPSGVIDALAPQITPPAISLPIAPTIPLPALPGADFGGLGSLPQFGQLLNSSALPADVRSLLGQSLVNLDAFNTTLATLNGFSGAGVLSPLQQSLFSGALGQVSGLQGQLQQLQGGLQSLLNGGGLSPALTNMLSATLGAVGNLAGNLGSLQNALQGIISGGAITSSLQGVLGSSLDGLIPDVLGSIEGMLGILAGTGNPLSQC